MVEIPELRNAPQSAHPPSSVLSWPSLSLTTTCEEKDTKMPVYLISKYVRISPRCHASLHTAHVRAHLIVPDQMHIPN